MNLVRKWFEIRKDFELALEVASNGQVKPAPQTGMYENQYFLGYCHRSGGYVAIEPPPKDFDIKKMYGM
jgi:hypothetical protein